MKTLPIRTTVSVLMTLILLSNVVPVGFAQAETRVFLQQVETTNDTLTVEVMVEDVTDLYGVQFDITYDPTVVSVQDVEPDKAGTQIEPGQFLPSGQGESFIVANEVDQAEGKVTFATTLLNPTPAVNGTGSLARITFDRLQNAPSVIEVSYVKLVSDELQTIPSEMDGLSIDSQVQESAASNPAAEAPPPAPTVLLTPVTDTFPADMNWPRMRATRSGSDST